MGQYYKPTIIAPDGRILSMYSHAFDSGSKLTEHSWIGNEFVNTAYSLILKSPKRVAWIGDYAKDNYKESDEAYTKAMPLKCSPIASRAKLYRRSSTCSTRSLWPTAKSALCRIPTLEPAAPSGQPSKCQTHAK